jgi:hypothetical protein
MGKRIVSASGLGLLFLAAIGATACSTGADPHQGPAASRTGDAQRLAAGYGMDVRDALRVKTDTARNRLWVLGVDGVRVYDSTTRVLVRAIALPNWSVSKYECAPDLVLDSSGSALVSSNVQPTLWRIQGASFEVTEHAISLVGKERWDIGFGPLAFGANGYVYGLTSNGISLWKIDLPGAKASMMESYLPPLQSCTLSKLSLDRSERNRP